MTTKLAELDAEALYAECSELYGYSTDALLYCITKAVTEQNKQDREFADQLRVFSRDLYILFCASLVFFMQAGFAMICAGAVRRKNLQNTMLKNLLDACGASVAFFCVGYAFAYGDGTNPNAFIGTTNFFLRDVDDLAFWFYQYSFSAASATIVAGTLAERCQMSAYFLYSMMLSGWVYPIVVHAVWSGNGFLSAFRDDPLFGIGVVDFAGSGVVHMTGGATALAASWVLGPRRGRFHDEETGEPLETPKIIPGHNIGVQLLGTLILWFGWYGFNSGSALLFDSEYSDILAALAVTNTTLAAGSAGISALAFNLFLVWRETGAVQYDLVTTMNGVLSGLVSITAGCGLVEPWAAILIGSIAGVLYTYGSRALIFLRLDDAVDAIPVHLVNGFWGMVAVGLLANPTRIEQALGASKDGDTIHAGCFYPGSDGALLGAQLIGSLFIAAWAICLMFPFFIGLELRGMFRSDPLDEIAGLDKSFHGGVHMGDAAESSGIDQVYLQALQKRLGGQMDTITR